MHHIVTPGFVDRPRRSDCTAGQMDGEADWWTTSENIRLPPLARVMVVGRQQQHHMEEAYSCAGLMSVSFYLPHPVAASALSFVVACVLVVRCCECGFLVYSKVRPRTFECVAMGSAMLFILRSRLLLYSAGSGVNRVQVVLSGFSVRLFCFV